jgi:hypothetical protein
LIGGEKYEGNWENGKMHGQGTYYYPFGNKYEGNWKNGTMHGKGTYTYRFGKKYTGDWDNNQKHGKGISNDGEGNVYEGEFKKGKMNGLGTYTFKSGNVYTGGFLEDKKNGNGIFKYINGDTYEGEFVNGNMEGKGTYKFANGNIYVGEWKDDQSHGKGEYTFKNGNSYIGEFKNGKRDGYKVKYEPTLYVPVEKKTGYKTLTGQFVTPYKLENIYEAKSFIDQYDDQPGLVYGLERFPFTWIAENYEGIIDWDIKKLNILTLDIEVQCENGFPDPNKADEEMLCITVKNQSNKSFSL